MRTKKSTMGLLIITLMISMTFLYGYEAGTGASDNGNTKNTAVGNKANADNDKSVALGYYSGATKEKSVAVGNNAKAEGTQSTALGNSANAKETRSTAVGNSAIANSKYATALGNSAVADTEQSTALGHSADALGKYSSAIGANAQATGESSIALGRYTTASATNSVALGVDANVTGNNSVALGDHASVTEKNSVALGSGSVANVANVVSVGASGSERKIVNVADATADHDAVAYEQLVTETNRAKTAEQTNAGNITINKNNITTNKNDITSNSNDITTNKNDITTNKNDITTNKNDITTNSNDITTNKNDITTNKNNITLNSVAIAADHDGDPTNELNKDMKLNGSTLELTDGGGTLKADLSSLDQSVDVARHEKLIENNSIRIETNSRGIAINREEISNNKKRINNLEYKIRYVDVQSERTSIGREAKAQEVDSIAIGTMANTRENTQGSIAIGSHAEVSNGAKNAIALGSYSVADESDTLSIGNSQLKRRITNLADGVNPYDAVNMRQLNALGDEISLLDDKVKGIGAMSGAMSAMVPNYRVHGDTQLSLGMGEYGGEVAVAMGMYHFIGDNLMLNIGASYSRSASTALRVGVSWAIN